MMDSDHLVHRLEDPAHAVAPYPSFYEGPRLGNDPSNDEHDNLVKSRREHVHYDNDCTLWIGNVDLRISETILFELFSQVGDIRNVSFPNNQGQNQDEASRFCFINFLVPDSVPKAIQIMQGTVLFGRKLFLKCRPGSIHALHSTQQRHQSSKYKPAPEPSQLKESPRGNEQTSTRWVRKIGADSTSDARGFSPIRAPVPSPESSLSFRASSSSSSSGRRKVVLVRDKYVDSPGMDERNFDTGPSSTQYQFEMDNIARRRVVIKSSSGSSIPVVNINTHTDQKRMKSVVVAAPHIKSVAKPEVSKPLSHVMLEATTGNSVKANTQSEPVHVPKSPRRVQESIPAAPEICYAHPSAQKIASTQSPVTVNSHPPLPPAPAMANNQGEQFTSSIEVVQPQPQQFHGTMMRPWRPYNNMQFQGHQLHQPRYYYNSEGMRPVFPHYNRHFQFNGGARHPPNFPRFKHFAPPPTRPYGHSYEHPNNNFEHPNNNFGQPNMGYQGAPFRPRFDNYSYRPRYDNQQYYDNAPQPNLGSPELFHNYSNDNRDPGMHQRYADPPVPPRVTSRSRTRSRSKSPYVRNYYREGTPADKSRRMKSRSRTLSPFTERRYKRRSVSRGSSCSYRSSSQRRNEGHRGPKRARRSRSKSYPSSDDNKKARTSRLGRSFSVKPIRRPTTSSDTSEYSDHGKTKGKSSGELSFSEEEKDNKNDNTTVSSSNHTAKKKLKKVQKADSVNNSQQSTKQGKGRKSRFIRTSVSSYRTEGEYDPSDPGY